VNEDKATRYHRLKRTIEILSLAWSIVLMAGLLVTGLSAALRDRAESFAGSPAAPASGTLVVLIYVALLAVINEIGSLPLSFYGGYLVERRYGLSTQSLDGWIVDQLKAAAVGVVLGGVAAAIVYAFIRRFDTGWWLPTGIVFALLIVGLANLGPVLLLPIFYSVKPLDKESLKARLMALADRAGARVLGVFEWGLAEKTKKANAALTGLGRTRRILISDTMLSEYSDDEIEVVLAHELAHHVHGDMWRGLIFESVLIVAGAYVAAAVLAWLSSVAGLRSIGDVAGLPLLLLSAGAVSIVMLPAAHALSRAYERKADRFALEMTKNPAAFMSAMKRLGAQNLAEEDPSRLVQVLFYSHPPIRERIAAARAFKV
jgi:STE24 endopeptidase